MEYLPSDILLHISKSLDYEDLNEWRSTCKTMWSTLHMAEPRFRRSLFLRSQSDIDLVHLGKSHLPQSSYLILSTEDVTLMHRMALVIPVRTFLYKSKGYDKVHQLPWTTIVSRHLRFVDLTNVDITESVVAHLQFIYTVSLETCTLLAPIENMHNTSLTLRTCHSLVPQKTPHVTHLTLNSNTFELNDSGVNIDNMSLLQSRINPTIFSLATLTLSLYRIGSLEDATLCAKKVSMNFCQSRLPLFVGTESLVMESCLLMSHFRVCMTLHQLILSDVQFRAPTIPLYQVFPNLQGLSIDNETWLELIPGLQSLKELHLCFMEDSPVYLHHLPQLRYLRLTITQVDIDINTITHAVERVQTHPWDVDFQVFQTL